MNRVLVDSSVWISFFKGERLASPLLGLLESNRVCVNDLILSELIPSLKHKKEHHLVDLIQSIETINIEIDWMDLIEMQTLNLKKGLNKVGIPDLIIAQTARNHDLSLYSLDKHFMIMKEWQNLKLFN